ncbi:MAG: uroporphyrinogen decarboxylase family protein [Desulfobacterales bacterium]
MSDALSSIELFNSASIPYGLVLCGAARRLAGVTYREFATNPAATAESYLCSYEKFGGSILAWTDLSIEAADFGQKMIYPEESTPHPDYSDPLIKDVSDYRKLRKIDIKNAKRMQGVLETIRLVVNSKRFEGGSITSLCLGPMAVLNMMRGARHFLRDCFLYPREVMAGMEIVTEVLVAYVEALADAGLMSVALDTLLASWSGVSRKTWEKIEGPFVRELAGAIRKKQRIVFIHNCGDGPYFDSQITFMEPMAISFAELPDDCKDRKALKEKYGSQVVLVGNISTPILSWGTPEAVKAHCRSIIEDLAPGGNFVLAPGCEFPPNGPFENAWAIIEAAREYQV